MGSDVIKLTEEQIQEVRGEMVPADNTKPVRFLIGGQALWITSGERCSRGSNVLYHPVYWNFSHDTALKIAGWLGANAVFSD